MVGVQPKPALGMGFRALAALAVLFLGLASAATRADAALFNAETFTLDNGLQVIVVPSHRAPVVTQMLWYKVGAADGPPGKNGIAHFLEHLMFKGTKTMPPGAYTREITRIGGDQNAITAQDFTFYYQSVAVEHLEMVMRMEADRMANLVITDDQVLPERAVIIEERSMRVDNDPQSLLNEMLRATLYLNHPYGTPGLGWRHEMETLTTADALAFYETWYAPNNALLIICGDVTIDQVKKLAQEIYGPIPRRDVPERLRLQEPPQYAARSVVLKSPAVQLPSWSRLYLAPSYRTGRPVALALDVLSEIVGDGPTSRLYRKLIIEQGIATSVSTYASDFGVDDVPFAVSASPQPGGDPKALEAAVDAVLADVIANGVTQEEVDFAKLRLRAVAIKSRDSLEGPAMMIGQALSTGGTLEDIEGWTDLINAVTVEQVNEAARAVLQLEHSATGLLLPQPPM
jgi:zinc protease